MKNPEEYNNEPVCIRCGDGWPICADYSKDAPKWVAHALHEASCAKYRWGGYSWEGVTNSEVCRRCDIELDAEETND